MRTFKVTVKPKAIKVEDYEVAPYLTPDYVALVDGERFQYFLCRDKNVKPKTDWWGLALNHIHYHAANSGVKVIWLPRSEFGSLRHPDISKHQLRRF